MSKQRDKVVSTENCLVAMFATTQIMVARDASLVKGVLDKRYKWRQSLVGQEGFSHTASVVAALDSTAWLSQHNFAIIRVDYQKRLQESSTRKKVWRERKSGWEQRIARLTFLLPDESSSSSAEYSIHCLHLFITIQKKSQFVDGFMWRHIFQIELVSISKQDEHALYKHQSRNKQAHSEQNVILFQRGKIFLFSTQQHSIT